LTEGPHGGGSPEGLRYNDKDRTARRQPEGLRYNEKDRAARRQP